MDKDNFILNLVGELDKSATKKDIESKLNEISKELNLKIGHIDFNPKEVTIQIDKLKKDISNSIGEIENLTHNLQTGIGSTANNQYKDVLHNLGLDEASVNKATSKLEEMNLIIDNISTSIKKNGKNESLINVNVTGTDELGRSVSLIQTFSEEEKTVRTHTIRIAENYAKQREELVKIGQELDKQQKKTNDETQSKYLNRIKNEYKNIHQLKSRLVTAGDNETSTIKAEIKRAQDRIRYDKQQLESKQLLTSEVRQQINEYSRLNKVQNSMNKAKIADNEVAQFEKAKIAASEYKTALDNLRLTYADANASKSIQSAENIEGLAKQYSVIEQAIKDLANADSSSFGEMKQNVENEISRLNTLAKSYQNAEYVARKLRAENFETVKQNEVNKLNTFVEQIKKSNVEFSVMTEDINTLKESINSAFNPEGLVKYLNTFSTVQSKFKSLNAAATNALDTEKAQQKLETLIARVNTYKNNNSKALKDYEPQLNAIIAKAQKLTGNVNLTTKEANALNVEFSKLIAKIDAAGKSGKTLGDTIREKVAKFSGWFSISQIIMYSIQKLQEMEQNVVNIDTAMTNLKKVTNETDIGYQKFLDNAIEKSRDLQINLSDVINQSAEWAKMGYSTNESMDLAEASGIYSVVGEVDNAKAVQDLTTAMKSYKLETKDAMSVVDKMNAISNQYATTAGDIGEILSNSASSLSVAGNTIDENIAMGVAIREITGDSSEAGNTLKVLSMRLRGAKTELAAAGEDTEGMAESTSKLRESIKALTDINGNGGFDIMIDDNTFKSTYDMMLGISKVWDKLNGTNQAALIELIAGKQRGNTVTALLTNMAQAQNIVTDSINSSGSAMEEYEKYLDSAEGKIAALKNEFEIFSQTVISSDLLKTVVQGGTTILKVISNITEGLHTIPTLLTAISAAMSFKNKGGGKTTPLLKMNMPFLNYNNELCA